MTINQWLLFNSLLVEFMVVVAMCLLIEVRYVVSLLVGLNHLTSQFFSRDNVLSLFINFKSILFVIRNFIWLDFRVLLKFRPTVIYILKSITAALIILHNLECFLWSSKINLIVMSTNNSGLLRWSIIKVLILCLKEITLSCLCISACTFMHHHLCRSVLQFIVLLLNRRHHNSRWNKIVVTLIC